MDTTAFLQVQRTPLLLANREGGCPFFFHDAVPFPLINAWRDAADAWCVLFFFSFSSADRSLLSDPLPPPSRVAFATRRPRSSCRLRPIAPSPFVAFTTSPPSRRLYHVASVALPCRVALSCHPLATCPPFAMPAAACRPFTTRPPFATRPLFATRHPRCVVCRFVGETEGN